MVTAGLQLLLASRGQVLNLRMHDRTGMVAACMSLVLSAADT